jgi:hypothetical protein
MSQSEHSVPRRIFGPPKKRKVSERKYIMRIALSTKYEVLRGITVIKYGMVKWVGHVACTGEKTTTPRVMGRCERKKTLARPWCR